MRRWCGIMVIWTSTAGAAPPGSGPPAGWVQVDLAESSVYPWVVDQEAQEVVAQKPVVSIVVPYRLTPAQEGALPPPVAPLGAPPLKTSFFVADPVREVSPLAVSAITANNLPEAPEYPRPYADEEIVVWGDRLQAAKKAIVKKMESMGYRGNPQGDGRTLWRPTGDDFWKPRVLMDDDGWYTVDTPTVAMSGLELGNPVAIGAPDALSTVEQAPPAPTIGPRFTVTGKRVAKAAEARLVREIEPLVRDLRAAQADAGLAGRLDALPALMERLWREGIDEEGAFYATPAERQRALLTLWATRTATRAGETVRVAVERYLEEVVDDEVPIPPQMIAEAEAQCGCRFGAGSTPASGPATPP